MTAPIAQDGPAAPPRSNGELVFAAAWESRAFGMAVSLHDAGVVAWPDFQSALIARIAAWESAHPDGVGRSYYEHWLGALEDVLVAGGRVAAGETAARAEHLAHAEPGHAHERDPGHS